jgi:DNA replication protein DnaC
MNVSMEQLQKQLHALRLVETANQLPAFIQQAEHEQATYRSFLETLLNYEQTRREEKQIEKRLKWASFPFHKTLQEFDLSEQESLSKKQLHQLRELTWLEQSFNLILLGPPGVGNYRKILFMARNKSICPICIEIILLFLFITPQN